MHQFFTTRHIFGFGPALIAVAADELPESAGLLCEAFVTFPKTNHPARATFDRRTYRPSIEPSEPNEPTEQSEPIETVEAPSITLPMMFDEGIFLARLLLMPYQENAYLKTHNAECLAELTFEQLDEGAVRRLWVRGYHRKGFKVMRRRAEVQSLRDFAAALQSLPSLQREDA